MATNSTEALSKLSELEKMSEKWAQEAVDMLPSLAMALVSLLIGWWLIGCILGYLRSKLLSVKVQVKGDLEGSDESDSELVGSEKHAVDPTLVTFLSNALNAVLKIILVITCVGMLGVKTTSFLAILTASTFAIGLALQGQLANLAAGVMIILFRSFKLGDYVDIAGVHGEVIDLSIFTTTLKGDNNVTVHIVPNGSIGTITIHTDKYNPKHS